MKKKRWTKSNTPEEHKIDILHSKIMWNDELSFTYEYIACFKEENLITSDSLQPEVEKL
jgi:hypothetical protein